MEEGYTEEGTPFLFQGDYLDPDTSLYQMQARWYDPSSSAFLSPDPEMGDPSDPQRRLPYAYCASDPVGNWDPTGRFFYGDEQKEAEKTPLGRLAVLLGYDSVASMLRGRSRGEKLPLAKAVQANVMRAKARAQRERAITEQAKYEVVGRPRIVIEERTLFANSQLLFRYKEFGNMQEFTFNGEKKTQIAHTGVFKFWAILKYDRESKNWGIEVTTSTLLYENTGNLGGLVSEGVTTTQKVAIITDKGREYEMIPKESSREDTILKQQETTLFYWRAESSKAVIEPDGSIMGPVLEGSVPGGEIPVEITVTNRYVVRYTEGPLVDFVPDRFSFRMFGDVE